MKLPERPFSFPVFSRGQASNFDKQTSRVLTAADLSGNSGSLTARINHDKQQVKL
jgi:hypothetical protein